MTQSLPKSDPSLPRRRIRNAAALAAVAIIGFTFLSAVTGVSVPRWTGLRILMSLMVLANVAWWTLASDWLLQNVRAPRRRFVLRAAQTAVVGVVLIPILQMLVSGHIQPMTDLPVWAIGTIQLWNMTLVLALP